MIKKILSVLLMVQTSLPMFAQFCDAPALAQPTMNLYAKQRNTENRNYNSKYYIRVYFHVLRASNGTGGVSNQIVTNAYNMLNSDYNQHGIYFIWNGVVDYIDNSSLYYSPSDNIFSVDNHSNGIDIYLYPIDTDESKGSSHGFGQGTELYVAGSCYGNHLATTHIISHEMGHILNLYHTHHGTSPEGGGDSNQCAELVDGSNSDTCGDYVEDTPADPGINENVNSSCVWIYQGTLFDINHDAYVPDTHLIMSYTSPGCMEYFSTKQVERMKDAIEDFSVLQNTLISMPTSISGSNDPCGSSVYNVPGLPSECSVTWSLSPSVMNPPFNPFIVTNSPQQNQCTINNSGSIIFDSDLCAAVKNASGTTVTTLTKHISNTFDLTFSQTGTTVNGVTYPSIPPSSVKSNGTIIVNHQCWVTLSSPYFENMTLSYTGASPQNFSMVNDTDLSFRFSNVTTTQHMYINGTDGCKVINLHVQVTPNPNIPIPNLEINPIGDGFEILLTYEGDEEAVRDMTARLQDMEWELNVANAMSGEKVQSLRIKGPRTIISTTGWKSGVYVLQAVVDGQECSKKITVK